MRHEDFVLPLYANGLPTLVFQTAKGLRNGATVGHLSLYGQAVTPSALSFSEPFGLIAYFLYPYVVRTILDIGASELTNTFTDLDSLKAAKVRSLQEQLLHAVSLPEWLQLIDAFLLQQVVSDRIDYSRIAFATQLLRRNTGAGALGRLKEELYSTERTIQRLFEDQIGISPKLYKRICQFDHAFRQLNGLQFTRLSDIAYQHGFSDQSHFIRVFKEFTGMSPKDYLALRSGYAVE